MPSYLFTPEKPKVSPRQPMNELLVISKCPTKPFPTSDFTGKECAFITETHHHNSQ